MPNETVNYVNAESIRPGYDWKPKGFLAGSLYAKDRMRYEDLAALQDQMARDQAQLSRENVNEGYDARQATRQSEVNDRPLRTRDLGATVGMNEDKAAISKAMRPGQIELGLGQQGLDKGQQGIARVIQTIAQTPPGPDYIPRLQQVMKDSGIDMRNPPPALKSILSVPSPEEAQKAAQAFIQQQSNTNPAYRQAIDVEGMRGNAARDVARIHGQASVDAARQRAAAKVKSYSQALMTENDPTKKLTLAVQIVADPESPEELKQIANVIIQQLQGLVQAKASQGQPPQIPGFPQSAPIPLPQPGLPQGQPQQNQVDPLGLRR